ncbi:MAG: sodium/proline symporter [Legionellales bacterium]
MYAYQKTQSYQDYIIGGRRFGGLVTAMGVAATDMSAWLMLGVPAIFYLYGLNQIWLPIGLLIGSFINWQWVAPRLRIYTQAAKNSLTLPSFFQHRFLDTERSKIRIITAIIFLIFFTCYATSGFVAAAKLFSNAFTLDYKMALYISAPVVILYTMIGGYLAINWIDLFQGTLMLLALVLLAILASVEFNQDWSLFSNIHMSERLDPLHDISWIAFASAMAWGFGYFGQPHILARFMSARGIKEIRVGKYVCLSWMVLAFMATALIGMIGYYYFPIGTLASAETIFPMLTQTLFSPWFSALVFAAIISALMSTVAAVLFAAASSLIEDCYHPLLRPKASGKELIWMGRFVVLITATIAALLALQGENPSIFKLVSHAWGGLGAAFGPVIIMSLFWSRTNYYGAVWGMVLGGSVTLIWIYCHYNFSAPLFQLYELIPGAIAGFMGVLLGSTLSAQPSILIQQQHKNFLLQLKSARD